MHPNTRPRPAARSASWLSREDQKACDRCPRDDRARGRGVGRELLEALVAASEQSGIWTLQAGIFPENTASVVIHERCGFRVVGQRERLGLMNGTWRDVLLLERRSHVL